MIIMSKVVWANSETPLIRFGFLLSERRRINDQLPLQLLRHFCSVKFLLSFCAL